MDTPKGLHDDVIWSKPGALKIMLEYNKRDVELLEGVYKRLKPYIRNHPAIHHSTDAEHLHCPKCGNENIQKRGVRVLKHFLRQEYQCQGCKSWMRGKAVAKANLGAS